MWYVATYISCFVSFSLECLPSTGRRQDAVLLPARPRPGPRHGQRRDRAAVARQQLGVQPRRGGRRGRGRGGQGRDDGGPGAGGDHPGAGTVQYSTVQCSTVCNGVCRCGPSSTGAPASWRSPSPPWSSSRPRRGTPAWAAPPSWSRSGVHCHLNKSDVKGRKIFSKTVMCSVPVSGWLHRPLLRDLRPRLRAGGGRRVPAARDHVSARLLRGHAGRRRGVPRVPLPPHHAQQPVHQGLLPGRGQPGGCPGHACPGHVSRVTQVTCRCPPGYTGRRCGECDAGFIGNPTLTGGACTRGECQCIVHLHLHIICCCLNIATLPTVVSVSGDVLLNTLSCAGPESESECKLGLFTAGHPQRALRPASLQP